MSIGPGLHGRPARPRATVAAHVSHVPHMSRVVMCAVLVLLVGSAPAAAVVLDPPVAGPVVAAFDAPTRYGPGHRGVDLGAPLGTPVRASAQGTVTFAGWVVGAAWVTVDHGAVRTTVGPLAGIEVQPGQSVARGEVVGTSGRAHGIPAVHWSLRRGDIYLDPLAVGRGVATLLPDQPGRRGGAGDRAAITTTSTTATTTTTGTTAVLPRWRWLRVR